jgi:hypothetical protein
MQLMLTVMLNSQWITDSVVFSQVMGLCRSRMTRVRCLALNSVRNNLAQLSEEQQSRVQ